MTIRTFDSLPTQRPRKTLRVALQSLLAVMVLLATDVAPNCDECEGPQPSAAIAPDTHGHGECECDCHVDHSTPTVAARAHSRVGTDGVACAMPIAWGVYAPVSHARRPAHGFAAPPPLNPTRVLRI